MSLTSYRAALPRAVFHRFERYHRVFSGLAVTYSPTSFDAVPLARRHLTAEFGMGSGVLLVLKPPDQKRSDNRRFPREWLSKDAFGSETFACICKRLVCLLPDQIKPIEPLVPVS